MDHQSASENLISPPQGVRQRKTPSFLSFAAVGSILLVFGLMGFWFAIDPLKQGDWVFGFAFLAVGVLCVGIFGGVIWWAAARRKSAIGPKPWLHRPDWDKGEIAAQENAASAQALGCIGSIASGTALYLFFSPNAAHFEAGPKWISLILGVAFSGGAVYTAFFRRKFGKSTLKFNPIPGVIGGTLEGRINLGASFPEHPVFELQLQCLEITSRSSKDETINNAKILWQSQWISAHATIERPDRSIIPVKFEIPNDCPESEDPLVSNRILWQLNAKAALPGLDYAAHFEVPVFCLSKKLLNLES